MIFSQVKTKQGVMPIKAYTADEVLLPSVKFEKWTQGKVTREYAADFGVLDTETSHAGLTAGWVYQWAVKFAGNYIFGRKPSELIEFFRKLRRKYGLNDKRRLILFIHNASYDLQYLKEYLMQYDENMQVMATDAHTFLITDIDGIRILCSYKLSNMSLDMFSRTYAETYVKAVGEIDYTKVRYQDSELTDTDWFYMFSDVASQYDALQGYLKINGYDRAYKAPYTSTGFVRANCRKASARSLNWHRKFIVSALTLEMYQLCRQAFMGGITICSWLWEGETIRVGHNGVQKIGHKDFRSSYPTRQMIDYMPVGKPFWFGAVTDESILDMVLNTYCCVFLLHLTDVHIKEGITAPYIPSSKCLSLVNPLKINGKVVYADSLTIAVTEIDYKWIRKQYTAGNKAVTNMLCFNRGSAPDWLKAEVMKYFTMKCTTDKELTLYDWVKALLNSIYGMSATSICRDKWEFNGGTIAKGKADFNKQITHYYNSRNSFMPYQIGIYTTAWARDALMQMIEAVGYEKFLYCDTDSVFYISTPENEARLQAMNEEIERRALAAGAYCGDKILGVATDEPELIAFRGLHAKCYAVIEKQKGLKVTIAGIPKKSIKWINGEPVTKTNAEELGDIENLKDGFTFRHCGGTRTVYIEDTAHTEVINGHETELGAAAIIENIEKTISETMWTRGADYSMLHIDMQENL